MTKRIVRALQAAEVSECEAILRALPEWFGIEQSLLDYVNDLTVHETLVVPGDHGVDGFLTWRAHNPVAAEIHCMAVRPEHHRLGVGGKLVRAVEQACRLRGMTWLQVKTLGPSRPDAHYAGTRRFYERMGFTPLEEHALWGERNPCLVLVKHLACQTEDG